MAQIFHDRIGQIQLRDLLEDDYPSSSLRLGYFRHADVFLGKITIEEYLSSNGPLLIYRYNLQPAVELKKQQETDGLKMLVMIEGSMNLQPGTDENWALSKGWSCLFKATEYWISLPENSNVRYLLFDVEQLAERMNWQDLVEGCYDFHSSVMRCVMEILQPPKEMSFPEDWLFVQLAVLLQAMRELDLYVEPGSKMALKLSEYAKAVVELINKNISHDFTAKELAGLVGTNVKYIQNAISQEFKMGVAKYQNQIRVELAQYLLLHTNKKISTIHKECGYRSRVSLCRNFSIQTKLSPSAWRKKQKR